MAYIRSFTFVIPPERTGELEPGHNLYLATVNGTQIVAQNSAGYLRGGVWTHPQRDGSIKVFIYTEWDGLHDMDSYVRAPMIRDYEADIAKYHSAPVIEVWELLA